VAEVGVVEASGALGVSPERVRQLIHHGELPARLTGGRYFIDTHVLLALPLDRPAGRPLGPRMAWALIELVETGKAPTLSYAERSRLRARLRQSPGIEEVVRWSRRRSVIHRLQGHRSVRSRVVSWPHATVTGSSAPGHDVIDAAQVEVYLPGQELNRLERTLELLPAPASAANVVVRVPAGDAWPFQNGVAGPLVVALDLWEAGDARSRRAARRIYDRELAARRYEPSRS